MANASYLWSAITQVTVESIRSLGVVLLCEAKVDQYWNIGGREQNVCRPLRVTNGVSICKHLIKQCVLLDVIVDNSMSVEVLYAGEVGAEPVLRILLWYFN